MRLFYFSVYMYYNVYIYLHFVEQNPDYCEKKVGKIK